MNVPARQNETSINAVSMAGGASGSKMAPQNLGEVVRFSEVMCRADIALPKHLRGNAGACMAVAMQALEWNMSPFAVASKSYSVGGAIAYEAQLIAAVVNTRSGIKGRLKYRFDGEGADLTCTVTGTLDGEECTYTSPPIGSITTKNSPLWKSDPQQQLGYFSARSWARRHCPEVILGVYDRDEAEQFRGPDRAKDVTPTFDPLSDEPASKPAEATEDAREGFDADFVTRETETLSTTPNSDDSTLSSQAVSEDAGDPPSSPAELDGDGESSSPSPSDQTKPDEINKEWLISVWTTLRAAVGAGADVVERQAGIFADSAKEQNKTTRAKATAIKESMKRLCEGADEDDELAMQARVIGVDPTELKRGAQ